MNVIAISALPGCLVGCRGSAVLTKRPVAKAATGASCLKREQGREDARKQVKPGSRDCFRQCTMYYYCIVKEGNNNKNSGSTTYYCLLCPGNYCWPKLRWMQRRVFASAAQAADGGKISFSALLSFVVWPLSWKLEPRTAASSPLEDTALPASAGGKSRSRHACETTTLADF